VSGVRVRQKRWGEREYTGKSEAGKFEVGEKTGLAEKWGEAKNDDH
jgi:hypothetical protein